MEGRRPHPVGQNGAVEHDPVPREDLRLAVERHMLAEFGDRQQRQQRLGRNAALDQMSGRRRLPSPAKSTMRARQTSFCGVLRSRAKRRSLSRSAAGTSMRSICPIRDESHARLNMGIFRQGQDTSVLSVQWTSSPYC